MRIQFIFARKSTFRWIPYYIWRTYLHWHMNWWVCNRERTIHSHWRRALLHRRQINCMNGKSLANSNHKIILRIPPIRSDKTCAKSKHITHQDTLQHIISNLRELIVWKIWAISCQTWFNQDEKLNWYFLNYEIDKCIEFPSSNVNYCVRSNFILIDIDGNISIGCKL